MHEQCTSCTGPAKNKMAAYMLLRIGWISQRIRRYLRLFHLRQYFNGKKIRRILKLYGLYVHNMIFFFSKRVFGAIFSDMSSPKFLTAKNWLPVQLNGFWSRLNGFHNNRLTTGLVTAHLCFRVLFFWDALYNSATQSIGSWHTWRGERSCPIQVGGFSLAH